MAEEWREIGCGPAILPDGPRRGWFQLAFACEVAAGASSWSIGRRRLILVREGERIRCFDGDCPHRGADLSAGALSGEAIICPFHHYRIALGAAGRLFVAEHPTAVIGGMVLVLLGGEAGFDLVETLTALERRAVFAEALTIRVRAPMSLVIENAFDFSHFLGVHGIRMMAAHAFPRARGGLGAAATMQAPYRVPSGEGEKTTPTPYDCVAYSPGLALVELKGPHPYGVVTGACDRGDGSCDVRLTFALPRESWGERPSPERLAPLIAHSRRGLEADRRIWESLRPDAPTRWLDEDAGVLAWRAFCRGFA